MMLIENTIIKLQEMKMTTMAKAFREQLADTNITSLPFEDRFGLIVDQEWTSRKNNHLKRLIKQAKFSDTGACVEDIVIIPPYWPHGYPIEPHPIFTKAAPVDIYKAVVNIYKSRTFN